jgi:hypothetical protein
MVTTIKVTALIAALGFVTVMLEQPRLTASPSQTRTSLEQRMVPTNSAEAPLNGSKPLPAPSSDNEASYFPSRFPAPGGEVASQPPTF